jgi:cold shock CspA family protein
MRGSITDVVSNLGYGFILGEDGCIVYFDAHALSDSTFSALSIGDWVEYEEQLFTEPLRANKVRSIPSAKFAAANHRV